MKWRDLMFKKQFILKFLDLILNFKIENITSIRSEKWEIRCPKENC
jgi:hypothetical protein